MKRIQAYIKPHKLSEVTLALHKIKGLPGMSVIDARGFGRGAERGAHHQAAEDLTDFIPHTKLELVCTDDMVESIVATIQEHAHTGLKGDGKIYISHVDDAIRISTGERGEEAV
ncbi:MAG: P-II family nitrogen regulator [FCB group bacterium]|nr:P-II family nitrogen regulator [FCB group bacterium]